MNLREKKFFETKIKRAVNLIKINGLAVTRRSLEGFKSFALNLSDA